MFYWFPVFLTFSLFIAAAAYFAFGRKPTSVKMAVTLAVFGVIVFGAAAVFWPQVNIYAQEMEGKAELAKADFSRKVKVTEAQATMDASKLLATAEIERAKGAAEANRIIADGLGGPEGYLRYLSIQTMEKAAERGNSLIYIPTDGGVPVTESGRALHPRMEKRKE